MKMAETYDSTNGIFEGFEPYTVSGVTVTDQELGTGAYATVLKVKYMGLKCAGKKIHTALLGHGTTVSYTVQKFRNECEILSHVRHPNIVQFLGVYFQQGINIPILLMEFLPLNLTQCISRYHLQDKVSYSILHDVALGLKYLHCQPSPIVHRDLTSNNVLLASNMKAKISDLGVARILDLSLESIHLTQTPGTPAFMPPEVKVAKPVYDTSVDEFSYGIMMIHVLSGKWPEPQLGPNRTEDGKLIPVSEAERRADFLLAIGQDHPLIHLILKCIHNSPQLRAHASEIVKTLADVVKCSSSCFANQLDMIDHIRKLEKENMTLRGENVELIKRHRKVLVQQRKHIISKLERKQEQDRKMMNQFIHDLKSLSEDVSQEIDHIHQQEEVCQDKSQLQCQVKRILSEPHERHHVKSRPRSREGSDTGKSTHVRSSSDTLHPLLKHGLKPKKGGKSTPTEICSLSDLSKSQSASMNGECCDTEKTDKAEIRTSTRISYTSNSDELENSLKSVVGATPLLVCKQEECTAHATSSPLAYRTKTRKRSKSTNTDEKESVISKHERQSSWSHPKPKYVSIDSVSHDIVMLSNVDQQHSPYTSPDRQRSRSSDESKVSPTTTTLSKDKPGKGFKLENKSQSEHGAVQMSPDTQVICGSSSNEENPSSSIKKEKDHLVRRKGQKHAVSDVAYYNVRGSSIQTHAKHKRVTSKEPHSPEQKDDNARPPLYTQRCKKVSESETFTVCDSSTSRNRLKDLTSDDLLYPIHNTFLDYNASPSERDLKMYTKSEREGKCGKLSSKCEQDKKKSS